MFVLIQKTINIFIHIDSLHVVILFGNTSTVYVFWIYRQKGGRFLLVINLTLADLSVGFTGKLIVLGTTYWIKQSHLPKKFRDLSFRVCNRIHLFLALPWPLSSNKHQGLHLERDYRFVSWN